MRALDRFEDCAFGLSPLSNACRKDGILAAAAIAKAGLVRPVADTGFRLPAAVFTLVLEILLMFNRGTEEGTIFGNDLEMAVVSSEGCCNGGGVGVLIKGLMGGCSEVGVLLLLINRFGNTFSNMVGKLATELFNSGFVGNLMSPAVEEFTAGAACDVA